MPAQFRSFPREWVAALLLAAALSCAWALRDWPQLAAFRLPDTDDGMRLQQVRDWIGGQTFGDLSQHRLGPAGVAMHWSRLPDLLLAAVIVPLTPLVGARHAELAALLLVPAASFAIAIGLTAGIARRLGAPAVTAALVAALAYPATTLFLPGRIDHHALQLVAILLAVRALLEPAGVRAGAVIGGASVLSLAIGLETAPLLAVLAAAVGAEWIATGAVARLRGYALVLAGGLALAAWLLASDGWDYPACDGFDAALWRAAQIGAMAPLLLAGAAPWLHGVRARGLASAGVALAAGAGALMLSPQCLSPYGAVDPALARLWLAHVNEAQSLFAAPLDHAIGYAGLPLAGLLATVRLAARRQAWRWRTLAALQLAGFAVTIAQLRGAYFVAMLGAPALAATIAEARVRGPLALAGAWLASAGLVYPLAAGFVVPKPSGQRAGPALPACTGADSVARLRALPPGTLLAPTDLSAYALPGSRLRVLAGPYHRNAAGNRAMYGFFLGTPDRARAIAVALGVAHVALCGDSFAELGPIARDSRRLIGQLRRGTAPPWLVRISPPGANPQVYRIAAEAR